MTISCIAAIFWYRGSKWGSKWKKVLYMGVSKMPYLCIGDLENAILLYRGSRKYLFV